MAGGHASTHLSRERRSSAETLTDLSSALARTLAQSSGSTLTAITFDFSATGNTVALAHTWITVWLSGSFGLRCGGVESGGFAERPGVVAE